MSDTFISGTAETVRAAQITAYALTIAGNACRRVVQVALCAGAAPAEVDAAGRIAEELATSAAAAEARILPLMQARAAARVQAVKDIQTMPEPAPMPEPEAPEEAPEAPEAPEPARVIVWQHPLAEVLRNAEDTEREMRRIVEALHDAGADDAEIADAESDLYDAQCTVDLYRAALEAEPLEPAFSRPEDGGSAA